MLNIMIVDDEPIVRIAFKSLVEWENYGFYVIADASNGIEGLKNYELYHPEIIISDIKMPLMDGLAFIEEIKKISPETLCIALSSYDDFPLVKGAYNLGIFDYILKPEMNEESLLKVLCKAKEYIRKQRRMSKERIAIEGIIEKNRMDIKEAIIKKLISGQNLSADIQQDEIQYMGIRIAESQLILMCIYIEDFDTIETYNWNEETRLFISSVISVVDDTIPISHSYEILANAPDEYVLIFSFNDYKDDYIKETCNSIYNKLAINLSKYLNVSITGGLSSISSGYKTLSNLYRQASIAHKYMFFMDSKQLINYERGMENGCEEIKDAEERIEMLRDTMKNIHDVNISHRLENILIQPVETSNFSCDCITKIQKLYYKYVDILTEFNDSSIDNDSLNEKVYKLQKQIEKGATLKTLNSHIEEIMGKIVAVLGKESYIVRQARKYIESNYDKAITLSQIASRIHVSEGYLSRRFSEQTGETLMRYLMKFRIYKAKEYLLKTNMKIYEVAEMVGYSNPEYFSKIFKEIIGRSPSEIVNNR